MNIIKDPSFGEMKYEHSWTKIQEITFWGKSHSLKIKVKAHKNNCEITQKQKDSYEQFNKNIEYISKRSLELVNEYIKNFYKYTELQPEDIVTPQSVIFKQDGTYVILCNFIYDEEHGLGITLSPIEQVGVQDIFL